MATASDTQPGYDAEEINHPILTFCFGEQRRHFLRGEGGTALFPGIDARQADGRKIPAPLMNGIEIPIQCRSDDLAEHPEVLNYGLFGEASLAIFPALRLHLGDECLRLGIVNGG